MKKAILGVLLIFSITTLVGCKDQNTEEKNSSMEGTSRSTHLTKVRSSLSDSTTNSSNSSNSTNYSSSTSQSEESMSESQEVSPATMWDTNKAEKLRGFMENWGQVMGQSYKEYSPGNNVKFYGLDLPDGVLGSSKKWSVAVNDQIVSAEWSNNGISSAEYTVVATYSDSETKPSMSNHVYFFALHNQQPIVLVSMQNQGMEDNALHFNVTENQDLKNGFASIVQGSAVAQPQAAKKTTTATAPVDSWSSMEEAIDFYEQTYRNPDNEVSSQISWENYDRKCWSVKENQGNRIVMHWANIGGAGGSYNEFIKNGETTQIIFYDGNNSYPSNPSRHLTVNNADHKVI